METHLVPKWGKLQTKINSGTSHRGSATARSVNMITQRSDVSDSCPDGVYPTFPQSCVHVPVLAEFLDSHVSQPGVHQVPGFWSIILIIPSSQVLFYRALCSQGPAACLRCSWCPLFLGPWGFSVLRSWHAKFSGWTILDAECYQSNVWTRLCSHRFFLIL